MVQPASSDNGRHCHSCSRWQSRSSGRAFSDAGSAASTHSETGTSRVPLASHSVTPGGVIASSESTPAESVWITRSAGIWGSKASMRPSAGIGTRNSAFSIAGGSSPCGGIRPSSTDSGSSPRASRSPRSGIQRFTGARV
jgi:hypothetical protein